MKLRLFFVLGLLASEPAIAQSTKNGTEASRDVIVLGQSRAEVKRQSYKYLDAILPKTAIDLPMSRFEETKVCPIAVGLTPKLDRAITDRLRKVAGAVAIRLAKADCALPNALVLFTDGIKPALDLLDRRYVGMMVDRYDMPLHFDRKGPVVVWHRATLINQNGVIANQSEIGGVLVNSTARQASRIEAPVHEAFTLKVVLIERGAVEGLTAVQVADYAAMRVFADTQPPRQRDSVVGAAPPTILTAIEAPRGSAVPASLTSWDLGLLRGLYSVSSSLRTSGQRGEIATAIVHDVMAPAVSRQ